VTNSDVGLYLLPFAAGNFLGPLLMGRLFDTVGRKVMISFTYGIAGVLLSVTGYLFWMNALTLSTQMLLWSLMFFFASAGASAAYLTVSEIFPMEIRAMAIAFFFIVAQGAGITAPWLYGMMIETSAASVFYGYLLGGGIMLLGAVFEMWLGVKAEGQSLEHLAPPLSVRTPGSL
jgi:MFS family permease